MKPDRTRASARELAEKMRRLPQPPVPDGLQQRLLSAVSAHGVQHPDNVRKFRWPRLAAGLSVAACLVLMAAVAIHTAGRFKGNSLADKSVSPHYILPGQASASSKETNPCAILPPLPQS
jgi:hypothetical protein